MSRKSKSWMEAHWKREISGHMNPSDIFHEMHESWGHEVKEHGLTMREAEHAMVKAQREKYSRKPLSKFHI